MDPSDEDTGLGMGIEGTSGCGSSQAGNSEHLSETLSSLSLTSLLCASSLAPPLVKKCNSTGNLEQGGGGLSVRSKDGRQLYGMEAQGYLSNPWTEEERGMGGVGGDRVPAGCLGVKSSSQTMDTGSRKNR